MTNQLQTVRQNLGFGNFVSVTDFGAIGNGTTDDSTAIQNALSTGCNVFFPNPSVSYLIANPITTGASGQIILGENRNTTLLTTPSASSNDMLRVAHAYCEIEHLLWQPKSVNNLCIRSYAGFMHLHHNRMLSLNNNSGTAVLLTEINPVGGGTVAGAYYHTIENNEFSYPGFAFFRDIDSYSPTNGVHACRFLNNHFGSDHPIGLNWGGGNIYAYNTFQSSTGTYSTPAGYAIDIGATVGGEKVFGNYLECYQFGSLVRATSNTTGKIVISHSNNLDGTTNEIYSLGATNYSIPF